MNLNSFNCCGIREIAYLSSHKGPENAFKAFAECAYKGQIWNPHGDNRWRYALFSQAGSRAAYGKKFKDYILKHKLGEVLETEGRHQNPNTGRILKAFIWTVDHDAAKKHYEELTRVRPEPTNIRDQVNNG